MSASVHVRAKTASGFHWSVPGALSEAATAGRVGIAVEALAEGVAEVVELSKDLFFAT